jgi:preprotein translocase subunit SecA
MDYLLEGINLRAVAQVDPLVAWQHDGFEMFGQLMDSIDDDYLRYVLHMEAVTEPAAEPDLAQAVYEAADDPVTGTVALAGQLLADRGIGVAETERAAGALTPAVPPGTPGGGEAAGDRAGRRGRPQPPPDEDTQAPLVKAPEEKVGRNDPCWCGSGKKYKLCHGAA